ncbi:MAG TPA: AAA family ATPase [Nitrospiraceae bacterium]|nr:AAA family ATPase [Nitrospiraceae bacterium]
MSGFVTVWLECQSDSVRRMFEELLTSHRAFLIKQTGGPTTVEVVCVELDEINPERTLASMRGLLEKNPAVEVFLTACGTDSQVMLEAFRIGIKEFLPQPINRKEFDAALSRLKERLKSKEGRRSVKGGKIVAFLGAKAGIGTSTLAVNLATSLRQLNQEKQVALVDFNLNDSDLPLFLDVQPGKGFRDLARDLSRLDATFVQSLMSKHESNLHLLQSGLTGTEGAMGEPIPGGAALHTLDVMRSMYDYVFVDCGHILNPETRETLDFASLVVLATTLSLPSIRRAKQYLQMMRGAGFDSEKVTIVVNRYQSSDAELLQHAEGLFEQKVGWLVPNDYPMASSSLNKGVPLTVHAPRAALTQWYVSQAAILAKEKSMKPVGAEAGLEGKNSLLSRYWGGLTFSPKGRA